MNIKDVNVEISKINDYLEKCLWMDFEVCQMNFIKVEIAGRIDSSIDKYAISIAFTQPIFIQGPLCWKLDNSRKFIKLASTEEFSVINKKYQIEKGCFLFKINMEDFPESFFFIAASDIKSEIYNENTFN